MVQDSYTYKCRPIDSHIRSLKWRHFQWPWTTSNSVFKVTPLFWCWISHKR